MNKFLFNINNKYIMDIITWKEIDLYLYNDVRVLCLKFAKYPNIITNNITWKEIKYYLYNDVRFICLKFTKYSNINIIT